jgi:hypothetical protein
MTVPHAGAVETTTVVPPLKTSPMAGPAMATATWLEGPTDARSGARTALAKAGRGTASGVAALAWATGAATASAAMTLVAKAARLLIGLMRLVVAKGLLPVRPRRQ